MVKMKTWNNFNNSLIVGQCACYSRSLSTPLSCPIFLNKKKRFSEFHFWVSDWKHSIAFFNVERSNFLLLADEWEHIAHTIFYKVAMVHQELSRKTRLLWFPLWICDRVLLWKSIGFACFFHICLLRNTKSCFQNEKICLLSFQIDAFLCIRV